MYEEIKAQTSEIVKEVIEKSKLKKGDILVVGCSTSVVAGGIIGTASVPELAEAVFTSIYEQTKPLGIYLAAQCCEHLNRAIIIEGELADKKGYDIVNVVPFPKAGGSFATAAYKYFDNPVAIEEIKANAGIDIGGTLIGMHLKKVAVPLKLSSAKIGEANVIAAGTRPKYIGGQRAHYDDSLSLQ